MDSSLSKARFEELEALAEPTQELQSETTETDSQTYSLFRERFKCCFAVIDRSQRFEMVTMVRRLAEQEHPAARVQLASCTSANMKFGVSADDDSAALLRSGGPDSVSITGTDFVREPHSARRSHCGGGFDQVTDGSKTFHHDAVNSIRQHRWIDLDKNTCQIESQ